MQPHISMRRNTETIPYQLWGVVLLSTNPVAFGKSLLASEDLPEASGTMKTVPAIGAELFGVAMKSLCTPHPCWVLFWMSLMKRHSKQHLWLAWSTLKGSEKASVAFPTLWNTNRSAASNVPAEFLVWNPTDPIGSVSTNSLPARNLTLPDNGDWLYNPKQFIVNNTDSGLRQLISNLCLFSPLSLYVLLQ